MFHFFSNLKKVSYRVELFIANVENVTGGNNTV